MKLVIDTSVIIDYLRTKSLDSSYVKLKTGNELLISLISVAELFSGKSARKPGYRREMLDKILEGMEINIPTVDLAKKAGLLRSEYDLSLGDAFIAALAIKLNLPLATLDTRDFGRIKGLKIYKIT